MQNTANNKIYTNVINLQSELLFREAEDDLYYFNHLNIAAKKLKKAIELTPFHFKSIMLYADICTIKGQIKKALLLYLKAQKIKPEYRLSACIANCYYLLKEYQKSIEYCDIAVKNYSGYDFSLYSQVIELKINSFINLKEYQQAYITLIRSQNLLDPFSLKTIYNSNYGILNEKIKLKKKLHFSGLKIV